MDITTEARTIIAEEKSISLHDLVFELCDISSPGEVNGALILESINDITNDEYPMFSYNNKKQLFTYTAEAPKVEEMI